MRTTLSCVLLLLAGAGAATAEALTLRLDPAVVTSAAAAHAAILAPEGYDLAYAFTRPRHQEFTLSCWACDAEFVEVAIVLEGAEVVEVRSRRPLDVAALVIRPGQSGPVTLWDVYIGADRVPPPPPPEEVRRRQAAAAALLARAQDALGIRAFTGAPAPLTLRLQEGAGLTLEAAGEGVMVTYALLDLGRPEMTERLEVSSAEVRWLVEVQPGLLALRRDAAGADANVSTVLQVGGDGWWEGTVETTTFPGGQRAVRPLTRSEAEAVLTEGVREIRHARERFGLALGRDLSEFRLP